MNPESLLNTSNESITIIGLLLCICAVLLRAIHILYKENKEKDKRIDGYIEKYYTLTTRINDFLDKF